MRHWRPITAVGLVAAAAALLAVPSSLAGGFPTDMQIARTALWVGDGVLNNTGANQTISQPNTKRNQIRYFGLRIEDSAIDGDYWNVKGCAGNASFKVKYLEKFNDGSVQNVTSQANGSGIVTGMVDSPGSVFLELQIRPTKQAPKGSKFACLVTADSVPSDVNDKDTVKALVKVKS